MIRSLKRTKAIATVLLLTLPIMAIGQDQSGYDPYIDEGSPRYSNKTYYHVIPGRFFIQRSNDVSQEYIISLLDQLTDTTFQYSWHSTKEAQDNICRVVIDDALIDSIIQRILIDDGVIASRRSYVKKRAYDDYTYFLKESGADFDDNIDLILKRYETWLFNTITCTPINLKPENVPIDSICNSLCLTYEMIGPVLIKFKALKHADIFEVSHKIFETGYFTRVAPDIFGPFSDWEMNFCDLQGTNVKKSDHYSINDGSTIYYYYQIPNRLYIIKDQDASQDYINNLLEKEINCEYTVKWDNNRSDRCEVIINDETADLLLDEILKDDSVLLACHVYVSKEDYERYLYYPYLEPYEVVFFNVVQCLFKDGLDKSQLDSLCQKYGLTYEKYYGHTYHYLWAPKEADMFDLVPKLKEEFWIEGCGYFFELIHQNWDNISHPQEDITVKEELYYNLAGQRMESPSGLTIVVTRYSDGSIRREKKLFR